jgi:hypothetical protein
MIRGDHVRQELKDGAKKFEEAKSVDEKVDVIYKLVTVLVKLVLSVRVNTNLIMKKVGVEPITPKTKDVDKEAEKE